MEVIRQKKDENAEPVFAGTAGCRPSCSGFRRKSDHTAGNVRAKLSSSRGEALLETLISIIIAVLCVALLSTSVVAASRINAKVKKSITEGYHFEYSESAAPETKKLVYTEKTGTGTAATDQVEADVYVYDSNGYQYYTRTGGGSNG